MCRSIELGGRRCPSHSDPSATAAYNAVRRQRYAEAKKTGSPVLSADYDFTPLDQMKQLGVTDPKFVEFVDQAKEFIDKVYSKDSKAKTPEAKAVYAYTNLNYIDIRHRIYGGELIHEQNASKVDAMIGNIDTALLKATPPDEPRELYRGVSLPDHVAPEDVNSYLAENFPTGGVISQKNFMSTSLSPSLASTFMEKNQKRSNGVLIQILSKKGAPLGGKLSCLGNGEMEVLMPREAKFKVAEVVTDIKPNADPRSTGKLAQITHIIRLVDVTDEDES
jgi:hypothetical protein